MRRTRSTALLAAGSVAWACSGPAPRAASPSGPDAGPFTRVVAPFPVIDSAGDSLAFPFLGGFNVPRPQLVDIDADGDLDLFVQERTGALMFFERINGGLPPRFAWRGDRYQDLDVGEWYRFADVDADGDLDLLAELPFSYVRLFRNVGSARAAHFVPTVDSLRDADGTPVFSDRQNIPQAADLDCDGLLDLLIGRVTGTVVHYEETRRDSQGVPVVRFVTDRFQNIEIVAQFGSLHGANTMALADIDADGDLDLFWGDFFEAGLLFLENTGSCETPSLRSEPVPFPVRDPISTTGYNAPAFGDLDGDGDLDLAMGVLGGAFNPNLSTIDNLYLLEQTAPGEYARRSAHFLGQIDVGSESIPALADLDGDGDLDLLVANKIEPTDLQSSAIYRFENVGSETRPAFRLTGRLPLRGDYHYAPALADLDADGDLDLVLGSWRNRLMLYWNEGNARAPRFVLADSALVTITRGSNTMPALADLDGDGDLDLLVGEASGALNYYRNDGTARQPRFTLVSDEYLDIDVGRRSAPTFADLDGDGDLDLVVGAESGELSVFENEGGTLVEAAMLPFVLQPYATPVFADLNGDRSLEVVAGGAGGGLLYYQRRPR